VITRQVRLSEQAKDQLSRLKGKTGIRQWNVLCRWALCLSLREPGLPADVSIPADSNVEMTWYVFGGEYHEAYEALVVQRCLQDGLDLSQSTLAKYFRLHLHRGISYLASTNYIRSLTDLVSLALEDRQ
jgi:DNA sulfur modification protein DndE